MSTIFDSIGIDPGIIIIALLAIVVILIGVMISNGMRLTRLERKYKMFMKGSDAQSLEKTFVRKFAQIDRLYEAKEDHEHAQGQAYHDGEGGELAPVDEVGLGQDLAEDHVQHSARGEPERQREAQRPDVAEPEAEPRAE